MISIILKYAHKYVIENSNIISIFHDALDGFYVLLYNNILYNSYQQRESTLITLYYLTRHVTVTNKGVNSYSDLLCNHTCNSYQQGSELL